jgi:uncharacterized protein
MKILVKDIQFDEIEREWDEPVDVANGLFDLQPHNTIKLIEPFHVLMKLYRVGENIDIKGTYSGHLEFDCDRCCERTMIKFEKSFHFILQPKKTEDEVIEEGDEEIDFGFYEGEEIDLSELAIEQLMLSIPIKKLCKEECKGICPYCGQNKNEVECGCEEKAISLNPFKKLIS